MSDSRGGPLLRPARALRARLRLISQVAAETRSHVIDSRELLVERLDQLAARSAAASIRFDSLVGRVDAGSARLAGLVAQVQRLDAARNADRKWLAETLRVIAADEPDRRRRLADLRGSDGYEHAYEVADPLVSVVIPTFDNHRMLVERSLPSVLAQTHQNFEVIVVGDAAPEAAREAVAEIGDARVSFHNLPMRGLYPRDPGRRWLVAGTVPYNEAVRRARGLWIAPLDDDDAFAADHIESLLHEARARRLELVYGQMAVHDRQGSPRVLGTFSLQAALYRADVGRMFDLDLADSLFDEPNDWGLCWRMARAGVRIGMLERVVVDYYPSPQWSPAARGLSSRAAEPPEWEYLGREWPDPGEAGRSPGWSAATIAQSYVERWPAFLRALEGSGPLGVAHAVPDGQPLRRDDPVAHNEVMVFAYVLALAARHGATALSVLDWGGALGHHHAIARALIPDLELDYHCRELPAVCEHGRRLSPDVHFHADDACLERRYDLVLASNSIQYTEDWQGLLARLGRACRRHLLVTRVPLTDDRESFVLRQYGERYGYHTDYPGWVLAARALSAAAERAGLEVVREFSLGSPPDVAGTPGSVYHGGFLMRRADVTG